MTNQQQQPAWTPFICAQRVADPSGSVGQVWVNSLYTVIAFPWEAGPLPVVHLSIRRNDRAAIRDWRHFQRIKNELVGPECEGVELFPAESRLVDSANQYHIFVIADTSFRWPFGWQERLIAEGPYTDGAMQRPFEPDERPSDIKVGPELDAMVTQARGLARSWSKHAEATDDAKL